MAKRKVKIRTPDVIRDEVVSEGGCGCCAHWMYLGDGDGDATDPYFDHGSCSRYPPPAPPREGCWISDHPVTHRCHSCGEFKVGTTSHVDGNQVDGVVQYIIKLEAQHGKRV